MTDEVANNDSGLGFLDDEIQKLKEQNRDLSIEVTRPVFGKQSCRLKVTGLESGKGKDDQGCVVTPVFETLDELVTITGEKKAPGMTYRPQFGYTVTSDRDEDKQRVQMDSKTVYYLVVSAGTMERKSSPASSELLEALKGIRGKEVIGNFDVRDGKKYDDDGNLMKFQTLSYRSLESAAAKGGSDDADY